MNNIYKTTEEYDFTGIMDTILRSRSVDQWLNYDTDISKEYCDKYPNAKLAKEIMESPLYNVMTEQEN